MRKLSKKKRAEIETQIEEVVRLGAATRDPTLAARAVALSNARVRRLFLKKLAQGHRFAAQRVWPADAPGVWQVFFELHAAREGVYLLSPSFLARVSVAKRRVLAVVDPCPVPATGLGPVTGGALPFTIAVPSNAPQVVTPESSIIDLRSREAVFFETLPGPVASEGAIPIPGPVPRPPMPRPPPPPPSTSTTLYHSPYDTAIASASTSDGVADDSTTDWRTDAQTDATMDRSD
jgi:hypothetical protein